jgi:hypothetical protein
MDITNTMCRLADLTRDQANNLVATIPDSDNFDFGNYECFIGFTVYGTAGTWRNANDPKIISYTEMMQLLGKTMEFTKSDLKTGMFVKYRNGGIRLVLADFVTGTYWRSLNNVAENLKSVDCQRDLDIMSVYEALRPANIESYLNGEDLKLIWERTEQTPAQKEMQELLSNIEKAEKGIAEMKEQAKVLQAKL